MRIEAELKAVVRDPAVVRAVLRERAPETVNVYCDVYYDTPDLQYSRGGREIRVRVVDGGQELPDLEAGAFFAGHARDHS